MSKQGSAELFDLIKSLTKGEKRYFKLFSERHVAGDSVYIRLFDAIEKQKNYNEKALSSFAYLAPLKKRLYSNILRCLTIYHADANTSTRLKHQIHQVELLISKGLLAQADKLLLKTKEQAIETENDVILLHVYQIEMNLSGKMTYKGIMEERAEKVIREASASTARYSNILQYQKISQTTIKIASERVLKKDKIAESLRQIKNHLLLKDERQALSLRAKWFYYVSWGNYHLTLGEHKKASAMTRTILKLVEENDFFRKEYPGDYFAMLRNFVISQYYLKQYREALGIIDKYKETVKDHPNYTALSQAPSFYKIHIIQIEIHCLLGEFETSKKLILDFERFMSEKRNSPGFGESQILFYFCAFTTFFGLGHYKVSNQYLNKIIQNNSGVEIRDDLRCIARIASIIVQYEMGHSDLVEYQIRWTYRYIAKKNRLYPFERIILDFFRKRIPKMHSKKETTNAFRALKHEITQLKRNEEENAVFYVFDFIAWVDSRIEGKSFADVVRKKAETYG